MLGSSMFWSNRGTPTTTHAPPGAGHVEGLPHGRRVADDLEREVGAAPAGERLNLTGRIAGRRVDRVRSAQLQCRRPLQLDGIDRDDAVRASNSPRAG